MLLRWSHFLSSEVDHPPSVCSWRFFSILALRELLQFEWQGRLLQFEWQGRAKEPDHVSHEIYLTNNHVSINPMSSIHRVSASTSAKMFSLFPSCCSNLSGVPFPSLNMFFPITLTTLERTTSLCFDWGTPSGISHILHIPRLMECSALRKTDTDLSVPCYFCMFSENGYSPAYLSQAVGCRSVANSYARHNHRTRGRRIKNGRAFWGEAVRAGEF